MRADEFLDLYRRLEELLTARYARQQKRYSSVVLQFMNDPDGRAWREELNVCRDIRNLLSHHADIDGEDIVTPSLAVIHLLREIVDWLENPPAAMRIATPREQLFIAQPNRPVLELMKKMEQKGFSHIPVMEGERVIGVFSTSTLYSYIKDHGMLNMHKGLTVEHFHEYLAVSHHTTERFVFVGEEASYDDLKEIFIAAGPTVRRVAAVFVTDTGKEDGALLGMVTPWDMIRRSSL